LALKIQIILFKNANHSIKQNPNFSAHNQALRAF